MRIICLNKKEIVPVKELGEEWLEVAEWWGDWKSLWGSDLAGKVLIDAVNGVGVIAVVKFKTTQDTVSIRTGLEWLAANGYSNVEMVSTEGMQTYPIPRVRAKKTD